MGKVSKFQMILHSASLGRNKVTGVTEWAMYHLAVTRWDVTFGEVDSTAGTQECRVIFLLGAIKISDQLISYSVTMTIKPSI